MHHTDPSLSETSRPAAFCLMGPTASGKTDLAVKVAKRLPVELISVDSAQVYRGMDIGSGKPDVETLAIAPHHLIDIRDPSQAYSAAEFRADAITLVMDIVDRERIPLLVGGTMLYFKVLRDGLADMPHADRQVREEIEQLASDHGWAAVHARLAAVDPESAERIHPNDPQRLQRALEVFLVTGKTMTRLHAEEQDVKSGDGLPFDLRFMALFPESRQQLHEKIAQRFQSMLRAGFVEEVERLYHRGDLSAELPSIKSVGYRQIWQYLSGQIDYDEMIERGIIATRQLAKRQFTWLRSWPELSSLGSQSDDSLEKLLNFVESASI
ncbi:MAG: tRNA (adenosine(37)-N6)-dimethylallyltransferase MiaA [Gammaproteobacteria bacterium]|nr:tRNA (adenosine(37)-N6)-dimethylallyltransferase MiaA [Gammaproteobacteria bacterium]